MRCVVCKLPVVSQKCSCRRLWSKKLITKSSFIIYQVDGNKSGWACFASLQWMADVSYQFNGQQILFLRPKKGWHSIVSCSPFSDSRIQWPITGMLLWQTPSIATTSQLNTFWQAASFSFVSMRNFKFWKEIWIHVHDVCFADSSFTLIVLGGINNK
jgi:hypothetical protein